MSNARNHHYVSKFYVAGFTKSGGSKAKIHVFDKADNKTFETNPRNIASQRDFNRVDIEGNENAVESSLSTFEDRAAIAFKRINDSQEFSNKNDFSILMNFICLLAIRNPMLRQTFGDFQKELFQNVADLGVSNEKIYNSQIKKMEESTGKKYNISYDDMKTFIEGKKYTIKLPNHNFVATELSVFDDILPYFFKRRWTLLVSDAEIGEFVTSDHPVTLISSSDNSNTHLGFGLKNTEVSFPISRYLAIVGVFEDLLPPVMKANKRLVADLNGRAVNYSMRHIFSAHKNFNYLDLDGEIKPSRCILN